MPKEQYRYTFNRNGKTETITVPRLLNLVPNPNPADIIGREREVLDAREKLSGGAPVMLVNGIGGIGKTTVAMKYLSVYEHAYKHIAWLTLSSALPDTFVTNHPLVRSLGLESMLTQMPPEQLQTGGCKAILQALLELDDCLLVLDNANELAELLEWQNALAACRAHVLITSRSEPQGWPTVAVENLLPEQARALFRKHYQFEQPDDAALDILLDTLDRHTLLTELSAKAAQASRIGFDDLLQRLQAGYIHDEALNKRAVDTGLSGQSLVQRRKVARVEAYVDLIFSEISQLYDSEKAQLKPFTLLPPAEWHSEAELENLFQLLSLELAPNTLDRLVEKGWLQREKEPTKPLAYKMHPLIQEVAVNRLGVTADWAAPVIQAVAEAIHYSNIDPSHDLFEKAEGKSWADYLEKRFRNVRTEQISSLLGRIAFLEENFGQYRVAAELNEKALDIDLDLFGPEHATVATRQSNLANVYRNLGEYEKARDLLEQALASDLKNFGKDHPKVALRQSNLANVYGDLGAYEKARELLEAALALELKSFGAEHPTLATTYNNLAHVDFATARYPEALAGFEKALEVLRHNFGEAHPYIDIVMRSIAAVREKMRD